MLTDTQKVNTRRWMGYGLVGDTATAIYSQPVYAPSYIRTGVGLILDNRLNHLTPAEETILVDYFLTNIDILEKAILTASDNLDTDSAAVWIHNKRERQDRESMFRSYCVRMCAFLNFPPGPGISVGLSLVRA